MAEETPEIRQHKRTAYYVLYDAKSTDVHEDCLYAGTLSS